MSTLTVPDPIRQVIDCAPAITTEVADHFDDVDWIPVKIEARVGIDTYYSTPQLVLEVEAVDPTGRYSYDTVATVWFESDGGPAIRDSGGNVSYPVSGMVASAVIEVLTEQLEGLRTWPR